MYPKARRNGLVTHQAGSDLLVYDETSSSIHQLNPLAARVWRLADGDTSIQAMATIARSDLAEPVTDDLIEIAIADLAAAGLLEGDIAKPPTQSRRALLRRAAAAGALVPAVVSVTAPAAAQVTSGTCAGAFATRQSCEADIPEREAAVPPGCRITIPFYCVSYMLGSVQCWGITGSYTC